MDPNFGKNETKKAAQEKSIKNNKTKSDDGKDEAANKTGEAVTEKAESVSEPPSDKVDKKDEEVLDKKEESEEKAESKAEPVNEGSGLPSEMTPGAPEGHNEANEMHAPA